MSERPQEVVRERLLDQIFDARTAPEIAAAREALHTWMRAHPNEPGMVDAFEVLSHREEMTSEQEIRLEVKKTAAVQ